MAFDIRLTIVGLKETVQFLNQLPGLWRGITTTTFRQWGQELTDTAANLSPADKLRGIDRRRRPESERLAKQWQWELGVGPDPSLNVGNVDEKMPFIIFPTQGGATIVPTTKDYLLFFDTSGNAYKRASVTKGATPGQPVHEWALNVFDLDRNVGTLADRLVFK